MIELKIDPEFENLIPQLTEAEFNQLKENILEIEEVINPILTWQGLIVDGHNRWKIIKENPDVTFTTYEMIFFSREDAKEWIIKNQLGRRNITAEQRLRLIGQMQENRKKAVGAPTGNTNNNHGAKSQLVQNEPINLAKSTAAQIAEEVGVSESTVKRAEKFSKGIDAIQEVSQEAATKILKGGSGVTKSEVINFPKMEEKEKEEFAERVINPHIEKEKQAKQEQITYTIENLLQEVSTSGDNYIKFLKDTLVKRSTVYAESENRKLVYEAVCEIKQKIESIENLLK